ncbi:hypothetical protein CR970_00930 [Candidatus Saccharibacteria bacterium]|nr:MAG: hypothetical protein CR970_00930 [Candidatus Saccharibacteria bacterium]
MQQKTVRPTKKQRELLQFIQDFITQHGYSPSYREIMRGLNYTSVATVALHVGNLIKRGHLRKRDHSARSLEVVNADDAAMAVSSDADAAEHKWLIGRVEQQFSAAEQAEELTVKQVDELYVLVGALRVLGLDDAARSFIPRIAPLQERV